MLDTRTELKTHGSEFDLLKNEAGHGQRFSRLKECFLAQDRQVLLENLGADRSLEKADRFVQKFYARIDSVRLERCANCVAIDLVMFVIGINEFDVCDRKPGQRIDNRTAEVELILPHVQSNPVRWNGRIVYFRIVGHAVNGKELAERNAKVAFVPNVGTADGKVFGLYISVWHFSFGILTEIAAGTLFRRETGLNPIVQRKAGDSPIIGSQQRDRRCATRCVGSPRC